ncbi:unnamed protein product [Larinioides sclopetarius]|uniref:Uncharacterized protein n=1 Tax=Larinioides sclopetarius TaxID=280406 RepID=A0AAV2BB08_9ARAC
MRFDTVLITFEGIKSVLSRTIYLPSQMLSVNDTKDQWCLKPLSGFYRNSNYRRRYEVDRKPEDSARYVRLDRRL